LAYLDVSQAEHGPLLDLAQDGEEGRLHAMAVQSVLASLKTKIKIGLG
jgi:hypothetical protein